MTNYFFITALPRSRTAWLANFFTTQTAFCGHDLLKDGWTAEWLRAKLHEIGEHYAHVGDADTALTPHAEELCEFFPRAKWLFVRNTAARSARSYRQAFAEHPYPGAPSGINVDAEAQMWERFYQQARAIVPAQQQLEVALDDLDRLETARACWDWLVPELTWSTRRWRMLDTFRVEIIPEKITVAREAQAA